MKRETAEPGFYTSPGISGKAGTKYPRLQLLTKNVVVTAPTFADEIVLAPIATLRARTVDRLFILRPGDAPFIKHESVVACSFAQISNVKRLEQLIALGHIKPRESMSTGLVQRIVAALAESDFTENGVEELPA